MTQAIHSIYHEDAPDVREFHGNWGSLAVSRNLYNGFQPLETKSHIFVVVGGPVLCFRDNRFLTGHDPTTGTQAIFDRYLAGHMQWDEDLSGPFAVLVVEKRTGRVVCVTDLLMFIPVYKYLQNGTVMLGTHVDALANAADQANAIDPVSLADFILNDVVTYPYTAYQNIRQLHPSAVHYYKPFNHGLQEAVHNVYWLPQETDPYTNINQAAIALRNGLQGYIDRVTEGMTEVAHFISGGEDSRALAGMFSARLKRHAFVFLDSMNREGRVAKRVAKVYGSEFHAEFRDEIHYLDILPEASDLIGSGHQYVHAHSLGFHKSCRLYQYPAVFGGYLSDSLLKAQYTRKVRGKRIFSFMPDLYLLGETRSRPIKNQFCSVNTLKAINKRRMAHLQTVQKFRKKSSHEWFVLWPVTMRVAIPNLYSNRRLFRIYEPFMCKEAVKISSAVPTNWKLNRRLFNKSMRPLLKPSRWLLHVDGRLPYFPWWFNMPIQFGVRFRRRIGKNIEHIKGNQGPWGDWDIMMKSDTWKNLVDKYTNSEEKIGSIFTKSQEQLLKNNFLSREQKINLLQVLYGMEKINIE